jgi:hypothetical protein
MKKPMARAPAAAAIGRAANHFRSPMVRGRLQNKIEFHLHSP